MNSKGPSTTFLILATIGIVLALMICPIIFAESLDFERDWQKWQFGWMATVRLVGSVIGILGSVALIRIAASGGQTVRVVPWIAVVLAGALIASQDWGVALGLGGVGVALALGEVLGRGRLPREDESPPEA